MDIIAQASMSEDELDNQIARLAPYTHEYLPGEEQPDMAMLDPEEFSHHDIYKCIMRVKYLNWTIEKAIAELPAEIQVKMAGAGNLDMEITQKRQKLARRWLIKSGKELLAPLPPIDYLIDGLIQQPSMVMIYGEPGSLKTMLCWDLAISITQGKPWLPAYPGNGVGGSYRVTTPGRILWVDQDSGERRSLERLQAFLRANKHNFHDDPHVDFLGFPDPSLDLSNRADADLLIAQIQESGARVCVIDNLVTINGGRDENAPEMAEVMKNLRWVVEQSGATVIIIHHPTKSGSRESGSDSIRGHGSIRGSLDLAIKVVRKGDELTISSTKTRDNIIIPFTVKWTWTNFSDGSLETAKFFHMGLAQTEANQEKGTSHTPKPSPGEAIIQEIVASFDTVFATNAPNQSELVKYIEAKCTVVSKTARRWIDIAEQQGFITKVKDGDRSNATIRIYRSPEAIQSNVLPFPVVG